MKQSTLKKYLLSIGYKDIEITGIDGDFKSNLKPFIDLSFIDLPYDDKEEIIKVISNYSVALEKSGGTVTDELRNIWISSSIINNTYHHAFSDRYDNKIYDSEYIVNSELKFDMNYGLNQVFTSTGEELNDMGYDIVVIDMDCILYFENHPDYEKAYPDYKVTMVKVDDRWYIAEEINTHSRWDECKDIWILN